MKPPIAIELLISTLAVIKVPMRSYPMEGSISGVAGWRFTTYYNMWQKSSRCCGGWAMCDIMRGRDTLPEIVGRPDMVRI